MCFVAISKTTAFVIQQYLFIGRVAGNLDGLARGNLGELGRQSAQGQRGTFEGFLPCATDTANPDIRVVRKMLPFDVAHTDFAEDYRGETLGRNWSDPENRAETSPA